MRETIISCGGEVRFQQKLIDLQLTGGAVSGATVEKLETAETYTLDCSQIILATD